MSNGKWYPALPCSIFILCGAFHFFAPHRHFSFLISHFSFHKKDRRSGLFLFALFQYRRQPGGNAREEAEKRDLQHHDESKRCRAGDDILNRAVLADALDDEEIHADRRCNEGQLHIDQEHDIEPDGIEAQRLDDRVEHRQRDEDDGNCFQHTPQNEQHDIDADEDDPAVHMPFRHERHERLRDLQHRQDIAEEHSADHDGKDHAGCLDGRAEDPRHITDRKAPVDEECDDERIDRALFDYSIVKTQYAGHAVEIAAAAAKDNVDIVVAIGGDGTINEIGRSLVHTNTALGIIPCGSGNGLARHLHIPMDAKAAIDLLNTGECTCVDYGKINDMPFFCTCGVGFDAFVSLKFADSGKRGLLTYLENTLHESLTYEPETYEIENEEGTIKYKAFLIACANASQYGNNAYIAPQASLTDGLMDVTILEPFTVLDVPSLSFQLFNKTIDQNSRIKTMRAKKIKIHRTKEGVMHYDGDPVMGGKDIEVELIPHGLNVIISNKKKEEEPFSLLQQIVEYFSGLKPKHEELIKQKYNHLFVLNRHLLRRLSKK